MVKRRCRHCGKLKSPRNRGLCWRCYRDLDIRCLYPAKFSQKRWSEIEDETMADVERLIDSYWETHGHWAPCPYPVEDPRYNQEVERREAMGLPARHPGDWYQTPRR